MALWDILHEDSMKIETGVEEQVILQQIAAGELKPEDCVRRSGEEKWMRIHQVSKFKPKPKKTAKPNPPAKAKAAAPAATEGDPVGSFGDVMSMRHHRASPEEEIDMAPAATLAFLLILFFVVASTVVLQKVVEYPAPGDDGAPPVIDPSSMEDMIRVQITAENAILVNDEPVGEVDLVRKLDDLRRGTIGLKGLVIQANEMCYHQTVVAVMDAATQSNMPKISLATPVRSRTKSKKAKKA